MLHASIRTSDVSGNATGVWSVGVKSQEQNAGSATWLSAEAAMQAMNESPASAEARARALLNTNPHDPQAKLLLGAALMRQRRWNDARPVFARLTQDQPQLEFAWRGLGQVLARQGERARAAGAFERALDLEIRGKEAWYALGTLLTFAADEQRGFSDPHRYGDIEGALLDNHIDKAARASEQLLRSHPHDPVLLKLRADVLIQASRWPEAKHLLRRSLEAAPDYVAARFRYATMLFAHSEFAECVREIDGLPASVSDIPLLRAARALSLALDGDYGRAVDAFDSFIGTADSFPGLWLEYGKVLRWAGDRRMSAAFRRATEILPSCSAAWYALATVKSFRWDDGLIGEIRAQLARRDLSIDDRALMHFVLGRAFEDLKQYGQAFENFRASKTAQRSIAPYAAKASQTAWRRTRLLFTPAFLRQRAGSGCPDKGPIFIVGMPRAGSTLVEQILSAHSDVEGLGELNALTALVEKLYTRAGGPHHWPLLLGRLQPQDFRALGEEYLEATRALRRSGAPFFTDKLPNNFQLTGLIHLILPNAKIVDVRRHPLDCGFSCFKHYFPKGHRFASDLGDIGERYADYVRLMAHFDAVLPGKVYRLIYERLVENFEAEVRRLLEHLALPFERDCLRFFENRRTVMTLSYEQVFMPLYGSGVGQWQHYEPWLGPLKTGLGPVLEAYPEVPKFFPDVHATSRAPRALGEAGGRFGTMSGIRQRPFFASSGAEG